MKKAITTEIIVVALPKHPSGTSICRMFKSKRRGKERIQAFVRSQQPFIAKPSPSVQPFVQHMFRQTVEAPLSHGERGISGQFQVLASVIEHDHTVPIDESPMIPIGKVMFLCTVYRRQPEFPVIEIVAIPAVPNKHPT